MNFSHDERQLKDQKQPAPRYQVNLSGSVIITVVSYSSKTDAESYQILQGSLLDVSRTGLALIISETDMQMINDLPNDIFFRLLLPLPAEAIELEAVPVRQVQLAPVKGADVLVGANITNMKGRDRIVFMDFINTFEHINQPKPDISAEPEPAFNPNKLIGMEVIKAFVLAKQYNHTLRVTRKNGSECVVARDYQPNRLNVATQDDIVTKILSMG